MAELTGTGFPVDLGGGVTLRAPGLRGRAERTQEVVDGRGVPPAATAALSAALADAGMEQVVAVEVEAQPTGLGGPDDGRGPGEGEGLSLSVPDLGPQSVQVLLVVDDAGIATWHLADEPDPFATSAEVTFTVPPPTPAAPADEGSDRGLIGTIGRTVLSVLLVPVLESGAKALARVLAAKYEKTHRPTRLRRFTPEHRLTAGADDLALVGGSSLTDEPTLLLLHGTFSTSHGGFAGLDDETVRALWDAYGGRVLAYDHPTLSLTPQQNAKELLTLVPQGLSLPVDIVAHSRGGLVARALADEVAGQERAPLRVRSVVFAATPNAGTALADTKNLKAFVDRMTTMLNLVPDGPAGVVADVLAGVLDAVKILAVGAADGLPGLQAMDPKETSLKTLGHRLDPATPTASVSSTFEPKGSLLSLMRGADGVADLVFGEDPNDLVVPTDGAAGRAWLPGHVSSAGRDVAFATSDAVWHCSLFSQGRTRTALLDWCRP